MKVNLEDLVIILKMIDFDMIVGQQKPIKLLKNLIKFNRVGHAYLFTGTEGVGKKITAIAFSKAINCPNLAENLNPCNHCSSCLKIEKGTHPDFQIISPTESSITIEQIRGIKEVVYWQPLENRKKIFLIDEAHKMTVQASNSLLKILEEPPPFVLFVLLSDKPENILPTIISRCQKIPFHPISTEEQSRFLLRLNPNLSISSLKKIPLFSKGSLSKAIALSNDLTKINDKIRYIDWLISLKTGKALTEYYSCAEEQLSEIQDSFSEFVEMMIIWFRDILFYQLNLNPELLSFPEKIESLQDFAQGYSKDSIVQILDYLTEIPDKMAKYIKPDILLENFIMLIGD